MSRPLMLSLRECVWEIELDFASALGPVARERFLELARANGHTDEEIEAFLASYQEGDR